MNRENLMFLLFGTIFGVLLLGTFLYFRHDRSFQFWTPEKNIVQEKSMNFLLSKDGYEERPPGMELPIGIKNMRNNHKQDSPTYYIDTAGFRQIVDRKNTLIRIDLACNGKESDPKAHGYHLYFTGWDTTNKEQFFPKMMKVDPATGNVSMVDAYLDKTCPCPLSGTRCPCETKK